MRKLIMWNLITLDGYFEGANSWDLDFHELVYDKEFEEFSIEQLNQPIFLCSAKRPILAWLIIGQRQKIMKKWQNI